MKRSAKYMLALGIVMVGAMVVISVAQASPWLPMQIPIATPDSACSQDVPDEPPPAHPRVPLEKIIKGTIVEIDENHIVADNSARGLIKLHVSPETRIWKGKWNSDLPIEVGDFFYGYGEPNEDGTVYEMEQMEVNIVSLRGGVLSIERVSKGLQVQLDEVHKDKSYLVHITQETLILGQDGEFPFGEVPLGLQPGDGVQVIGLQLKDGSVLATRVF